MRCAKMQRPVLPLRCCTHTLFWWGTSTTCSGRGACTQTHACLQRQSYEAEVTGSVPSSANVLLIAIPSVLESNADWTRGPYGAQDGVISCQKQQQKKHHMENTTTKVCSLLHTSHCTKPRQQNQREFSVSTTSIDSFNNQFSNIWWPDKDTCGV